MKTEELERYPATGSQEDKIQKKEDRELVFESEFLEDLKHWGNTDKKTFIRVMSLIQEIKRDPFNGTGKPERLKHLDGNTFSRRINKADRLVYRIGKTQIHFIQARYHYDDH